MRQRTQAPRAVLWFASLAGTLVVLCGGAAWADPQADYILNCRGCHRPDGSGLPGAAPSFRGRLGAFLHVPGGREYLIRVPGTSQSELNDARIAALLNWMIREFSPPQGDALVPFTAEEVARYRHPPLNDPGAVRRRLLEQLSGAELDRSAP